MTITTGNVAIAISMPSNIMIPSLNKTPSTPPTISPPITVAPKAATEYRTDSIVITNSFARTIFVLETGTVTKFLRVSLSLSMKNRIEAIIPSIHGKSNSSPNIILARNNWSNDILSFAIRIVNGMGKRKAAIRESRINFCRFIFENSQISKSSNPLTPGNMFEVILQCVILSMRFRHVDTTFNKLARDRSNRYIRIVQPQIVVIIDAKVGSMKTMFQNPSCLRSRRNSKMNTLTVFHFLEYLCCKF